MRRTYLEGAAAAERGDLERAAELLGDVVADNPNQLYALDTLGLVLTRLERWGEAITTLRARLARGPGQAATHVNLGFTLEATGRRDQATLHYRRALELDPTHPTARANLERVAPGKRGG
jgi:Flp pilus assembly protein TadD